jgi:type IV pilus assembly protein PilY1
MKNKPIFQRNLLVRGPIAALIMLLSLWSSAADIDIFRTNSANVAAPNVLFVLDNSANWNSNSSGVTKQQIMHEALFKFLDSLKKRFVANPDFPGINLGILVYSSGNSPKGGKAIQAFLKIESANDTDINAIKARLYCNEDAFRGNGAAANEADCLSQLSMEWGIAGFDDSLFYGSENLPKTNNAPMALAFNEAYLWFAGESYQAGQQDDAQSSSNIDGFDPSAFNGSDYISPIDDLACANNYMLFISNGGPDSGENNVAESKLDALGGVFAGDPLSTGFHSGEEASWLDEYARFLNTNDINDDVEGKQNVSVYAVDVFEALNSDNKQYDPSVDAENYRQFGLTKPDASKHALMYNASAGFGGGDYLVASDADALAAALNDVIDDILEKNSVFAAVSLPVSVNIKGTNENQIYMGIFRPSQQPRWAGNLKLYQIGLDSITGKPILVDAEGAAAEDTGTGFIETQARSFWTASSTYWTNIPTLSVNRGSETTSVSDNPDGKEVERGGVAQGLREYVGTGRTVYTCTGTCSSLKDFATSNNNLNFADFAAADAAEMNNIINWSKGIDLEDADNDDPTDITDIRPNVHGDVIHSQPVVINYGGTKGPYVFYGSNDGMFHAVKGGIIEKTADSSSNDGEEVWAFTAPEHFPQLKVLYDNITLTGGFDNKPYFFDGSVGSYVVYDGDNEVSTAIIYLTARRGGDLLYALDVTDPELPVIKWRKSRADDGYSELGQTWSKPVVTKLKIGADDKIVLMMGLGYDPDVDDGPSVTRTQGRGVIVIDALTGEDIWQVTSGSVSSPSGTVLSEANMTFSVPSDLAVVDRDGNGYSDRVYFGDTGGQLWRLDIASATVADWKATRLFKFSTTPQRFLNAPDVVESPDGNYDMIIIGSGNREKPVDTSVQNYMLFYRDYDQTSTSTSIVTLNQADLATATTAVSGSTEAFDPDTDITSNSKFLKGWYLTLEDGEKVVTSALTTNEVATFATNLPGQNDACTDLGEARIYKINPFSVLGKAPGEKNYVTVEGGGFLPPPVGFTVIIEEPVCDADGNCTTEEKAVSGVMFGFHAEDTEGDPLGVRRRVWWYSKQDK